ncbi:PAS domain S-box protein [Chloroflexota bacterium]
MISNNIEKLNKELADLRGIEKELRASKDNYRNLFDNAHDLIQSVSSDGRILYVNNAWRRVLGYSEEEIRNLNYLDIIHPDSKNHCMELLDKVFSGETVNSIKAVLIAKNGTSISIEGSAHPKFENGKPVATQGIFHDVTERMQAEEEVQRNYDIQTVLNKLMRFSLETTSQKELLEYAIDLLVSLSWLTLEKKGAIFLADSDTQALMLKAQRGLSAQLLSTCALVPFGYCLCGRAALSRKIEFANYLDDRHEVQYEGIASHGHYCVPLVSAGKVLGVICLHVKEGHLRNEKEEAFLLTVAGILAKLIELNQTAEELKNKETIISDIVENAEEWIWETDVNGKYTYASSVIEKILGYKPDEILGKYFFELFHPEDREEMKKQSLEMFAQRLPFRQLVNRNVHKNGSTVWLSTSGTPVIDEGGNFLGYRGADSDITKRKNSEEIILDEATRRRILIEQSRDGIVILDQNGNVYEANRRFADMLGYSMEETRHLRAWDWDYQLPREQIQEMLRTVDENGDHFETRHRRKDGTIFDVEISSNGAVFAGQKLAFCVCRDITERKQAEKALKYEERRYHDLMENLPIGLAVTSADGNTNMINKAYGLMFGYDSLDEWMKISPVERYLDPKERERWLTLLQEKGKVENFEVQLKRKDGSIFWGSINSIPLVTESDKKVYLSVTQNITERKQIEEYQQTSAKLESVGTLAGGIAHDFNNILTGIMGNIELAEMSASDGNNEETITRMKDAKKASMRARDLTQQLLTFSKGGKPIKNLFSIVDLIKETISLGLSGSSNKPVYSIANDLWTIEADEGQISQVINNIIINADQAMPNSGIINLKVQNLVIEKDYEILPLNKGKYVEIAIEDHGTGIPREHLQRIFEPYFTTKQKGSGLGLATSYSIIKNHGGCLTVESEPDVGTTFHIYLPASNKTVLMKEDQVVQPSLTGHGRILVMDDEDIIRALLKRQLVNAGYEVVGAENGSDAIELYKKALESGQGFDAVIMDLTIPGGMGGKEAITKLIELDPEVRAIVSSGYSNDPIMADFKNYGFSGVVAKPYQMTELEKTIREAIGEKR